MSEIEKSKSEATQLDDGADKERRDALRKLGTYGALTAPALLAILTADKAIAQTSA